MKKILSFISILVLSILLVACNSSVKITFDTDGGTAIEAVEIKKGGLIGNIQTPIKEDYEFLYWTVDGVKFELSTKVTADTTLVAKWALIEVDNIVFSKLFTAIRRANNVIELYNNSDNDINLADYRIDVYSDGSKDVETTIALRGTIEANSYFTIGGANFDDFTFAGVGPFDLTLSDSLPFNGDDAMALVKKTRIVDFIGFNTGIGIRYSINSTLIRMGEKEDYQGSKTYNEFGFIKYLPEVFQYLANDDHEIKTLEQIMEGPRLEDFYLTRPYAADNKGTGGAVTATLVGIADGDTATFNFAEKPAGTSSHRYYFIDTPEVGGPNTNDEPWGAVASKFNKDFLLNNSGTKELRVQSVPNSGLHDTYMRNLGLIWINGHLSQFLIVSEGLSKVDSLYNDVDLELYYKDIPYRTFLIFAQYVAKNNGWGLHGYPTNPQGEMSPDWDYRSDSRAPLASYSNWTPHQELPW